MKFRDQIIFKEERFSIGIEEDSGKPYLSIPVSNNLVDYEEYYELDLTQYHSLFEQLSEMFVLAKKCKSRQNDDKLIVKPGKDRGTAN